MPQATTRHLFDLCEPEYHIPKRRHDFSGCGLISHAYDPR